MDICFITAKDDVIDQKRNIRLIQGNKYELVGENEDVLEIVDETGKSALFSREHFYGYWEV